MKSESASSISFPFSFFSLQFKKNVFDAAVLRDCITVRRNGFGFSGERTSPMSAQFYFTKRKTRFLLFLPTLKQWITFNVRRTQNYNLILYFQLVCNITVFSLSRMASRARKKFKTRVKESLFWSLFHKRRWWYQ